MAIDHRLSACKDVSQGARRLPSSHPIIEQPARRLDNATESELSGEINDKSDQIRFNSEVRRKRVLNAVLRGFVNRGVKCLQPGMRDETRGSQSLGYCTFCVGVCVCMYRRARRVSGEAARLIDQAQKGEGGSEKAGRTNLHFYFSVKQEG